jgi:hypothetical protein
MALFTPTVTARPMRFDVDDFDFTPSDDEIGKSPEETVGTSPSDQPGTSSAGQVVPDDVIPPSSFTMDDFRLHTERGSHHHGRAKPSFTR